MKVPQTTDSAARRKGETYRQYVTIYRPSGGSPYYRLLWTDPATGKRRERKGGTTLAGARAKADDIVAQLMVGTPPESARAGMRARAAFAIYVQMSEHPRWQEREQQNQMSRWRVWIDPVLGTKKCSALRRSDLEAVLASMRDYQYEDDEGELIARPLSKASMERCKSQLGQWAKWLHANGYTTTNIATGLDVNRFLPRTNEAHDPRAPIVPKSLIPSQEQCQALAAALDQGTTPWWGLACRIASTVGPRYGELAALDLDSVNREKGVINIRRSLVPVPKSEDNPLGWKFGTPKNRQLRGIPILAAWRDELEARMEVVAGDEDNEYHLLFPSLRGKPYRQNNWYGSTYRKAVDRLPEGSWPFTWHATRHSAATLLLQRLRDVDASAVLGHSTVQFTRDRYLGVEDDYLGRAAAALDALE